MTEVSSSIYQANKCIQNPFENMSHPQPQQIEKNKHPPLNSNQQQQQPQSTFGGMIVRFCFCRGFGCWKRELRGFRDVGLSVNRVANGVRLFCLDDCRILPLSECPKF
ncbi:F-box protein SKIP23 [Spatholobus suberectus]|nr:F-box protein SKIP23 [Spatholobus suberectus]